MVESVESQASSLNVSALFSQFRASTDDAVNKYFDEASAELHVDTIPDVTEFTYQLKLSVANGKRLRALGTLVGAYCVIPTCTKDFDYHRLLRLAAALEFYQASALIHDDVIDQADTRRGQPALHRALAEHHRDNHWVGSVDHFGTASAILAGNYGANLADWCVAGIENNQQIAKRYAQMTAEVSLGQYLDLKTSQLPLSLGDPLASALEVVRLKSARYSVIHPVALGALLAGASTTWAEELANAMEPAGIAFQMRDDYLGAFGQPNETGKPVGGDIVEKKRTVLLALAYRDAPREDRVTLDNYYTGDQRAPAPNTECIRGILKEYGAPALETFIDQLRQDTLSQLKQMHLSAQSTAIIKEYLNKLICRQT